MISIRASSVPAATRCIHSIDKPVLAIENINQAQLDGTYAHAMLAAHVAGNPVPEAPNKDTEILFRCGVKMWRELSQYFPDPMVEQELSAKYEHVSLTGHADVVSFVFNGDQSEVRVLDWKSGRIKTEHRDQLLSYALMVADAFSADSATITTAWLRYLEYTTERFTKLEFDEERSRLLRDLRHDGPYRTGDHCKWCARRHECPAHRQLMTTAASDIAGHPDINLRAIEGDKLGDLLAKLNQVESDAKAIRDGIRNEIMAAGPLDIGGGRVLKLREEQRREVDAQQAIKALRDVYGDKVLDYASITCGAIDRLASDSVDKGKGEEKELVNSMLKDAGAITTKTIYKIVEGKKEIEE